MPSRNSLLDYCIEWNNQTLYPETGPETARCHLNIGLFYSEVFEDGHSAQTMICSSNNQLFLIILRYLQCSVTFVRSSQDFGGRLVAGHWTGILGLFEQRRADLVGHVFAVVNQREAILDQTYLMPKRQLLAIFSYPKLSVHHDNPFRIFDCFAGSTWLLVAGALLAFAGLHCLGTVVRAGPGHEPTERVSARSLALAALDMFAILVGQGDQRSARRPLLLWILSAFVLRQLFGNDFTAVLLSQGNYKLDRFEQLHKLPASYRVMLEPNSSMHWFFERLFPRLMPRVQWYSHIDIISVQMLDRLIEQDYVLIINADRATTLKEHYPGTHFHISQERLVPTVGTYAMRTTIDPDNRNRLTKLFRSLYHYGLMLHVDRRLLLNHLRAQYHDVLLDNRHTASGNGSIFYRASNQRSWLSAGIILKFAYMYLIGIGCSVAVLALELILHRCRPVAEPRSLDSPLPLPPNPVSRHRFNRFGRHRSRRARPRLLGRRKGRRLRRLWRRTLMGDHTPARHHHHHHNQ